MKQKSRLVRWAAALTALVALALFMFLLPDKKVDGHNLLRNSDFEAGMEHWDQDAYVITQGYTLFEERPGEGRNGTNALYIRNDYPNDARFLQEVAVESDAIYHLHGYVRASARDGWGGNLSVDGMYVYSDRVFDSPDEWQEVSLYGKTGKDQKYLTVFVRLGGYSGESVGEAWFDDVTLSRVDKVPEGYYVQQLYKETAETAQDSQYGKAANGSLLLAAAVYLVICYCLMQQMNRQHAPDLTRKGGSAALIAVLAVAFAVRMALAILVRGYDIDVNDFMLWAQRMTQEKPWGFYVSDGFCDYPPGALLILWALGGIGHLVGGMNTVLVKMPSILCDLAIVLLMYRAALKAGASYGTALGLAVLAALNPLMLTAGAAWGQVDSVMVLLLLWVVAFALDKKWRWALPVYVLAVLFKPQALMFGPLGLLALSMDFYHAYKGRDKEKISALWMQFLQGMAYLVLCAAIVVVPFSVRMGGIGWLFELYGRTMSHYAQATVNSCNLYFLFGLNWVSVENTVPALLPFVAVLVGWVPAVCFAYIKKQPDWLKITAVTAGAALMSVFLVCLIAMPLSSADAGTVLLVAAILLTAALYVRGQDVRHLPLLGSLLLTLLFTLGTMMHERYLVPAVALLILAYIVEKDKRILWVMAGVTVMCLFNVGAVLDRNIRIGGAAGHLSAPYFNIDSDMKVLEYLSAVMSVVMSMGILYLSLDLCRKDRKEAEKTAAPVPLQENVREKMLEKPDGHYAVHRMLPMRPMEMKDFVIMGAVTVLFAALTLTNLGSRKAPQQEYVFSSPEEQVVFDLGEESDFRMLYYGGIHWYDSHFTVEVSRDGVYWEGPYTAEISDSGDCFKWKYVTVSYQNGEVTQFTQTPLDFTARYVRITADHVGLTLFEVLFRDQEGHVLVPRITEGERDTVLLINEQDTLEGEPNWYNSTYFDEIYHARTAYEHLNGLRTYEWTHPPLGKVLMSAGIALFGMTPFGWRFAGAVMGILMLPGMYLLGKALFKKRWCAVMPMVLMALDFMHFTQTRIATIDSFVVCFIIWAVYFMVRYMGMDYWHAPRWKALLQLSLSGLFMGLSVASKWTGCYAGVGLALLFFWSVWRRAMYVYRLKKQDEAAVPADEKIVLARGYMPILQDIASCFLFFVAVPLVIYYVSYIPHFAHSGGVTVKKILNECERMLSYHGTPGLGMDHFYSPWYEWPFAVTPMWYSSSRFEAAGLESSIMAFGNPAVWWVGAVTLAAVAVCFLVRHVQKDMTVCLHTKKWDARPAVLIICFLAQYLPWTLVPRGTYIYHYFTAVPFVILANTLIYAWLEDKMKGLGKWLFVIQCALALGLFIAFFPYISGVAVPVRWMDAMKWFPDWLYY